MKIHSPERTSCHVGVQSNILVGSVHMYLDGMDYISEWNFGGESESMVDNWFSLFKLGNIQCYQIV